MVDKLENTQKELRGHVVKRTMFSVFSNLIVNFGFALGYLVAFLWAAIRMSAGTLSFGGMTAFCSWSIRFRCLLETSPSWCQPS